MVCGSAEAESKVYQKVQSTKGKNTYYVPVNGSERAGNIYVDPHDPKSEGFAGRVISFPLEDGTVDEVKGPWHTNCDALFEETGLDLRNEHRTFVVLGMGRTYEDHKTVITDVIYQDPEGGLVGSFDRYKELELQYPEAEQYYSESRGGSSCGQTTLGRERWLASQKKN